MSEQKHIKHPPLKRPALGEFHRNEWAFIGAPCGKIQEMAGKCIAMLDPLNVCYIDADHARAEENGSLTFDTLTDKIGYKRWDSRQKWDRYEHNYLLNDYDLVLVNGNHFSAKAQIIILHPSKLESLQRKTDRLGNVQMVILTDDYLSSFADGSLPGFLDGIVGSEVPLLRENDIEELALRLRKGVAPARLLGLVLAGGESSRMGRDKTVFEYHGKPHREFLYEEMEGLGIPAHLSLRKAKAGAAPGGRRVIWDSFEGLGPFGAILSAFREEPDAAWLVVAADLPFFGREAMVKLMGARKEGLVATTFRSPHDGFPEPLACIWEPRAYPRMLQFLAMGYSCPRKVLINSVTSTTEPEDQKWLWNVNRPEDLESTGIR